MNERSRDWTTGYTTSSGAPAPSDRNSLSIGPAGPILLRDVHFLEQMAHFNREKVPERQPHAKGAGAFGHFETTADVSKWTKAALFKKGAITEMLARFSTVAGEAGSPTPGATFAVSRSSSTPRRAITTSSATTRRSSSCATR